MTNKEYQHIQYLKRRANLGAEEINRRNRESYLRNKQRVKARQREYYQENREKVIARTTEYHKRRPEIARKAAANYAHHHPDRVTASQKKQRLKFGSKNQIAYYWRNRERLLIQRRPKIRQWWKLNGQKWTDKNREKIKARRRELRSLFPEQHRTKAVISASKRRARKKLVTVDEKGISRFIKAVRSKTSVKCFWCDNKIHGKDCHIDHIIAIAKGGKHSVENLCVSCEPCNLKKGAKSLHDWNLAKPDPQLVLI